MSPFADSKMKILRSINHKLVTCSHLVRILNEFGTDEEKLRVFKGLRGNVKDSSENWVKVQNAFSTEEVRREVIQRTS
jgi:hypothetical protein